MLKKIKEFKNNLTLRKAITGGEGVRDAILKQGLKSTEGAVYFWGNATKAVQDSSKSVLTAHNARRLAISGFKATKVLVEAIPFVVLYAQYPHAVKLCLV